MCDCGAGQQEHARILPKSPRWLLREMVYCAVRFQAQPQAWPRARGSYRGACVLASPLSMHLPVTQPTYKIKPPAITMATSQTRDFTQNHTAAESFTSSTRPINNNSHSTRGEHSTTATMSDINGKAPLNGAGGPARDINEPIIKVQPPRREDLQPSYARVIKPDDADADTNGWYGSMVCPRLGLDNVFATDSFGRSMLLVAASVHSAPSLAASCAPIHTSQ